MSFFNSIEVGSGRLIPISQSFSQLPFGSNTLTNQLPALAISTAKSTANNILGLVLGPVTPFLQQSTEQPTVKKVTFLLRDSTGKLPATNNNSYPPGYQFDMLVNPQTFNISYPKKTAIPVRTMGGWVIQYWFPELGGISAEGIVGNLLEAFNNDTKDSQAWSYFKKLIQVYQMNGVAYQASNNNRNFQSFIPTVECHYDGYIYQGFFEDFSYSEEESNPWTRKYNFSFKFTDFKDISDITSLTNINNNILQVVAAPINGVINTVAGPTIGIAGSVINHVSAVSGVVSEIPSLLKGL